MADHVAESAKQSWMDLVDQASEQHQQGQHGAALAFVRRAQSALSDHPPVDTLVTVDHLNSLGVILFENGYFCEARHYYQQSLVIVEHLSPEDENLCAHLHNNLGQTAAKLNEPAAARTHLERAVLIRERLNPDSVVLAIALDNLGSVLSLLGIPDNAEKNHIRALSLFKRLKGPLDNHFATALGNLSQVYIARGDRTLAEACRLRALDIHRRNLGSSAPATLNDMANLAVLYLHRGDEAYADALMNKMLGLGGEIPEPKYRYLAYILYQLAQTALAEFRLDLAERLSVRALILFEILAGKTAPDTMAACRMLGHVHLVTGEPEKAEQQYKRAMTGYQAMDMEADAVATMLELAKAYRENGGYALAQTLLQQVVSSVRKLTPKDPDLMASALGNLGLTHYAAGNRAAAAEAYDEALVSLADEPTHGERPWLLHCQAMLKQESGDYPAAIDFYEQAKTYWLKAKSKDHPHIVTTTANLALVYWADSDIEKALAAFSYTEQLRDKELGRILSVGSEEKRNAFARKQLGDLAKILSFNFSLGMGHPEVALLCAQTLLRRKNRVLDSLACQRRQIAEQMNDHDKKIFSQLQWLRSEITEILASQLVTKRSMQNVDKLASLVQREQQLEADISYQNALNTITQEALKLADIQAKLPSTSALLEFVNYQVFSPTATNEKAAWGSTRYAVMVLRSAGEPAWFDLGDAAELNTAMEQWRRLLRNPGSTEEQYAPIAATLHQRLISPLLTNLTNVNHLLISPDADLVTLPFGLLLNQAREMLCEQYLLSYLTSGRDVLSLNEAESGQGVVVMAAADFDAMPDDSEGTDEGHFKVRGRLCALPGTQTEADAIITEFGETKVYTGKEATTQVLKKVHKPAILHIATHGLFVPQQETMLKPSLDILNVGGQNLIIQHLAPVSQAHPMCFSALALAGANRHQAGIISAQELAGLDLGGTELVVLSACETGLGSMGKGEEFTGLCRALAIAGAKTQLSTLWKIPDEATQCLMSHYYACLRQGCGRAEALQKSQRHVARHNDHPEWCHPFFWAAFISVGAWTPIPWRGDIR
ncbi:MAG: CHAT domain-containing protein [Gammaproteobacteria bacterium]|nr:CHAT domain-containing protein [Gammaproteobacteria bacterium]